MRQRIHDPIFKNNLPPQNNSCNETLHILTENVRIIGNRKRPRTVQQALLESILLNCEIIIMVMRREHNPFPVSINYPAVPKAFGTRHQRCPSPFLSFPMRFPGFSLGPES